MTALNFSLEFKISERGKRVTPFDISTAQDSTVEELIEYQRTVIQTIAREVLKEEQAKGFPKKPITVVDGVYGGRVEDVKAFGTIMFTSPADLNEVLFFVMDSLLKISPVKTGKYKSSHQLYKNGTLIASNYDSLKAWVENSPEVSPRDRFQFVDTQPYAGKLERYGVTNAGTNTKYKNVKKDKRNPYGIVKKPSGVYFQTAEKAKRKYKSLFIFFEFQPGSKFGIPNPPGAKHAYVYPTILVYVSPGGTK